MGGAAGRPRRGTSGATSSSSRRPPAIGWSSARARRPHRASSSALDEPDGLEAVGTALRGSPLPGDRRPCLVCVASLADRAAEVLEREQHLVDESLRGLGGREDVGAGPERLDPHRADREDVALDDCRRARPRAGAGSRPACRPSPPGRRRGLRGQTARPSPQRASCAAWATTCRSWTPVEARHDRAGPADDERRRLRERAREGGELRGVAVRWSTLTPTKAVRAPRRRRGPRRARADRSRRPRRA